jgi:hypothetical protein
MREEIREASESNREIGRQVGSSVLIARYIPLRFRFFEGDGYSN